MNSVTFILFASDFLDVVDEGKGLVGGVLVKLIGAKMAQLLDRELHDVIGECHTDFAAIGVDGDEEAMNLQKYQEAYDICANVITVMTECYDKLINEMGV